MRIGHWLILYLLVLTPNFALAETIELVCVHRDHRGNLIFKIDTLLNTVLHNGVLARDVYIDRTTISFIVDLTSGEYFHFISRQSGNMTVKTPHGTLIYGYKCAELQPKPE
jgi:hypothetical protein